MYKGKNCIEKFCQSLREHEMEIIKFKKKKNDVINKKWHKKYKNANFSYICKEKFEGKHAKYKKYRKAIDYCHYTGEYGVAGHIIRNLKHRAPKKTPMVFNNGSNHDYHFIIKELAEKIEGRLTCLGENTKNYLVFSCPIVDEVTRNN